MQRRKLRKIGINRKILFRIAPVRKNELILLASHFIKISCYGMKGFNIYNRLTVWVLVIKIKYFYYAPNVGFAEIATE